MTPPGNPVSEPSPDRGSSVSSQFGGSTGGLRRLPFGAVGFTGSHNDARTRWAGVSSSGLGPAVRTSEEPQRGARRGRPRRRSRSYRRRSVSPSRRHHRRRTHRPPSPAVSARVAVSSAAAGRIGRGPCRGCADRGTGEANRYDHGRDDHRRERRTCHRTARTLRGAWNRTPMSREYGYRSVVWRSERHTAGEQSPKRMRGRSCPGLGGSLMADTALVGRELPGGGRPSSTGGRSPISGDGCGCPSFRCPPRVARRSPGRPGAPRGGAPPRRPSPR